MSAEEKSGDWFWWVIGCGAALGAVVCAAVVAAAGWFYLNETPTVPAAPIVVPTLLVETAVPPTLSIAPTATLPEVSVTVATRAPAATSTPLPLPNLAGSAAVTAARAGSPPQIDGRLDEWGSVAEIPLTHRVFTRGTWDGSADLAAVYRLQWDDSYLYLAVAVQDERHVQTFTGRTAFRGDSLELQFDTDRAGDFGGSFSPDDYQFILSPGDFEALPAEAYRFRGTSGGQMDDFPGQDTTVAAVSTADGYTLEARIPWSDLGLTPRPGLEIGACFNANDNDQGGESGQEIMISNVSTRTFGDPTTWGTLTLGP